ncbi:GNAT family N-acetyltransferase [Paenibacillus sp. CF384]|uniref:GNAT family N-acetyltransferase n=1 Tax=Paenibacillus sp. CF384 TaxID=1884382 RepID=UPI00089A2024|nr:GNAT family N-acetyltransferase [Paenibacillus sp. CF384]SDW24435.1 Protein N-acetyltransferase, RimJ/RimL family [Paenibacillus sp. CF384]
MYAHRPLLKEDLETISSFPQSAEELFYVSPRFQYPLTPDQIMKVLENRFEPTVILDEESGQVIAYANLYDIKDEKCWLGNVIVSSSFRGKGAAAYLLQTMKDKAKTEYGALQLVLSCASTNSRGLAFYHKLGFKPIGMRINNIEDQQRVITFQMMVEL